MFITMDGRQLVRERLKQMTKKKHVYFVKRGNAAIKEALRLAKAKGCTKLFIPDQGGWLTYPQYGKELGFEVEELKTDTGIITPDMIEGDDKTVLLINSMPAYAFTIDTEAIAKKCAEQGIFFINDVVASIGTDAQTCGAVAIGSFGRWKPLAIGGGGFIATDEELALQEEELDFAKLLSLLDTLQVRTNLIASFVYEFKKHLPKDKIIHAEHRGYNAIVRFAGDEEKEKLINIAKVVDPTLEHTVCPRYIRVQEPALCFEVKRKFSAGDD